MTQICLLAHVVLQHLRGLFLPIADEEPFKITRMSSHTHLFYAFFKTPQYCETGFFFLR